MAVEIGAAVFEQDVGEEIQAALCGDIGIELANGAGGEIARIGEGRQSVAFAFFVHLLERRRRHQQFAANFEIRGNAAFFSFSFGIDSGIERTVRTLSVTSSPTDPSPRVTPRASLPSS